VPTHVLLGLSLFTSTPLQISQDIATQAISKESRRAFVTLVRLKLHFVSGRVPITRAQIAVLLGKSEATIGRHIKALLKEGYIHLCPVHGHFLLKNLNPPASPLTQWERRQRKAGKLKRKLSTVRLTAGMGEKEILAHLSSKVASIYLRQCQFMFFLKTDDENLRQGRPLEHFNTRQVLRLSRKLLNPIRNRPNKDILIGDRKMALHLGITNKDFQTNFKKYWMIYGLIPWTSRTVRLKDVPVEALRSAEDLTRGKMFAYRGHAYKQTTKYLEVPKL
jgi:hypothetical protein